MANRKKVEENGTYHTQFLLRAVCLLAPNTFLNNSILSCIPQKTYLSCHKIFFDKELYRPENKVHQLIQQLYVAGMVGTEEDCLAVIAVELAPTATTRTQLSTITRLINRQAEGMPVAVLFRYGNYIALANAERTQYKQTYRKEEKNRQGIYPKRY